VSSKVRPPPACLSASPSDLPPLAIFRYAIDTRQDKLVEHFQPSVQRWIVQWKLPLSDQRDLFLLLSSLSSETATESSVAAPVSSSLDYLIKYFETFVVAEGTFPAPAVTSATAAVVRALQSSAVSDSARRALHRSLAARESIIKDASLLSLLEVLRLLVTGDLAGFIAFHSVAANAALLSAHSVSSEHIIHSLKLLKLCHLASTASSSSCVTGIVLPYDAIASALQVSEDEVEVWVVEAISLQLLEASMDQFKRVVVVRSALSLPLSP
jgi:translation initiation factor 3 subunit M